MNSARMHLEVQQFLASEECKHPDQFEMALRLLATYGPSAVHTQYIHKVRGHDLYAIKITDTRGATRVYFNWEDGIPVFLRGGDKRHSTNRSWDAPNIRIALQRLAAYRDAMADGGSSQAVAPSEYTTVNLAQLRPAQPEMQRVTTQAASSSARSVERHSGTTTLTAPARAGTKLRISKGQLNLALAVHKAYNGGARSHFEDEQAVVSTAEHLLDRRLERSGLVPGSVVALPGREHGLLLERIGLLAVIAKMDNGKPVIKSSTYQMLSVLKHTEQRRPHPQARLSGLESTARAYFADSERVQAPEFWPAPPPKPLVPQAASVVRQEAAESPTVSGPSSLAQRVRGLIGLKPPTPPSTAGVRRSADTAGVSAGRSN